MSKTIYKYPLEITNNQTIELPINAEILCVQMQDNSPHMWVLLDPNEYKINVVIDTFGTGHLIDDLRRSYISTYQTLSGLVFHCFERLR